MPIKKKKTVIIFYRPKDNSEIHLANQQKFLNSNKRRVRYVSVIDCTIDNHITESKIFDTIKPLATKAILIIQGCLRNGGFGFNDIMEYYFQYMEKFGIVSVHLMDIDGHLYSKTETKGFFNDKLLSPATSM